jgi:putative membrane protein
MNPKLKVFLLRWANNTVAVLVAASLIHGIRYDSLTVLVVAALSLGILNTFVKGILILFSLPLVIFSAGIFIFFINAFLLCCVGYVVPGFHVDTFWAAFWGGLIISFVSGVLNLLVGASRGQFRVQRGAPPGGDGKDGGDGPVIDV